MLFTAFIAICMSGTPVPDCNRHTAVDWVVAPENAQGHAYCAILGQEYVANARLLKPGQYAKVFCRPVETQSKNVG